jgi:hypothetical protein
MRVELLKRIASPALLLACLAAAGFAGCERKERVIDVKTPAVDVQVDRDVDTGKVEVETRK